MDVVHVGIHIKCWLLTSVDSETLFWSQILKRRRLVEALEATCTHSSKASDSGGSTLCVSPAIDIGWCVVQVGCVIDNSLSPFDIKCSLKTVLTISGGKFWWLTVEHNQ